MPVEQGRSEPAPGSHGSEEDRKAQSSDSRTSAVSVNEGDGDPVIPGSLREREGEDEDTNEDGAWLPPSRQRTLGRDIGRTWGRRCGNRVDCFLGRRGVRYKGANAHGHHDAKEDSNHQKVDSHTYLERHHSRTDQ